VLALIGVLVIVAVVVWFLFYSNSRKPVEPVTSPPVVAEPQPSEAVVEEPPEAPGEVTAPDTEAPEAEEALQEKALQPEEQQADTGEKAATPEEEPTDLATEAEEKPAPKPAIAEIPTGEDAKPAAPKAPSETEELPPAKETLPKITFMDEEVEKSYRASRFFASNRVAPSVNPFAPPLNRILPRDLQGPAEQLESMMSVTELRQQGVEPGEIPLLPLPGEAIGEATPIRLIGIALSGETATAMFAVSGGEGEKIIMAHAGWLVGNDYVFIGAENGRAKIFDRKSNEVIQLATGETL